MIGVLKVSVKADHRLDPGGSLEKAYPCFEHWIM